MSDEPLISVDDLSVDFHSGETVTHAVKHVSFDIAKGGTMALVGESGSGKTVTALSILKLLPYPAAAHPSGAIRFKGENLLALPPDGLRHVRGNKISMIFQEPMTSLNPVFSVGYQISEVLMLHRDMTKEEALAESVRLLQLVGISDPEERVSEYPFQLSGGLRQRVMIAIAMACEPDIMIADEPTTALDVTIQAQILRLMAQLKERTGASIMFITHDLAVIASFADRVMVMYAGVVVEQAPVREVFKKPLHPYTQGLLGSIPVLGEAKRNADGSHRLLSAIPGTLPDHRNFPKGCRFAPRCTKVMARCWEAEPALVETADDHQVRCFLHSDAVQPAADTAGAAGRKGRRHAPRTGDAVVADGDRT
jgi:peptide/nickel transport system ATP-binding protein